MLELRGLSKRFGGLKVLEGIDFVVPDGGIHGLIGPNGAGKTTLFNLITGLYAPTTGTIAFDGASLVGRRPHRITQLGVARTFQNIRVFKEMTLLENVVVGHASASRLRRGRTAVLVAALSCRRAARARSRARAAVVGRSRRAVRRPRRQPVVRQPAQARTRARARDRAEAAAARRAGRRHEQRREDRPDARDRGDRQARLHGAADRARHALRDGPVRARSAC